MRGVGCERVWFVVLCVGSGACGLAWSVALGYGTSVHVGGAMRGEGVGPKGATGDGGGCAGNRGLACRVPLFPWCSL